MTSVDTLQDAMRRFDQCVRDRDRDAAESILDDGYALVLVIPSAGVMPRRQWLDVLEDYVVHEYVIEEQLVDEHEDNAAVLTRARMQATVLGQDRSGIFAISDFWRKRDDRWRLWRRHSTPLSAGPMPPGPASTTTRTVD